MRPGAGCPSLSAVRELQEVHREPWLGRRAYALLGLHGVLPCRLFCRRIGLRLRGRAGSGRAYLLLRRRRRRRRRRRGRRSPLRGRWWGRGRSWGGRGEGRSARRCRRGSVRRGGGRGCRGRGWRLRRGVFVCLLRPGGIELVCCLLVYVRRGGGRGAYLVHTNWLSIQAYLVHNPRRIFGILFADKLHEPISLMRLCHPVLGKMHIDNATSL